MRVNRFKNNQVDLFSSPPGNLMYATCLKGMPNIEGTTLCRLLGKPKE